ncbi:MAG: hypothetical protein HY017_13655 [Betaproteobacteria bacterium]|nr:hypothetical protein [Betaproteobacteria bacterium]
MSPDFKDLLSEFNAHGVEYLVVGAYALAAHGRVRATGDLDVWVRPDPANAKRVLGALVRFGAPLQDLTEQDLSTPGIVYQIGVAPLRIDVLTAIDAIEFEEAWQARIVTRFADQSVSVLSAAHLIRNKRAVGRAQDIADLEWLERSEKN